MPRTPMRRTLSRRPSEASSFDPDRGASRRARLAAGGLAVLVVALVIGAAYLHTISYPFQFDDFSSIRNNHSLDDPLDLGRVWRFRPSRFLVHESLALNVALTGRSTGGMRAINLLIHLAVSLLVGWIARELVFQLARGGRRGAAPSPGRGASDRAGCARTRSIADQAGLWAALLFAAHPLATQAVTYLIQRTTSLAALFELGAVALYLAARRAGEPPEAGDRPAGARTGNRAPRRSDFRGAALWAGSWLMALLAALTKEMAVALPFVILLLEMTLRARRGRGASWRWLWPYLAVLPVVAVTASLYSAELGRAPAGLRETAGIGRISYLLTQLTVIPRYARLAFWPAGQNLDPDIPVRTGLEPVVLLGAVAILAVCVGAWAIRRSQPLLALGWGWFLITLAPESSLIPIRDVMAEHRAYLPLVGLAMGMGALLAGFSAGRPRRLVVPALLVAVLMTATWHRNRVWRDDVSLWADVTAGSPGKPRGFNNLGLALMARGDAPAAEAAYRRAIALDSTYVYAQVNLGQLFGLQGRYVEALDVLKKAAALEPENPALLNNLGNACWALGDTTAAAAAFQRALDAAPQARTPAGNLDRLRSSHAAPQ